MHDFIERITAYVHWALFLLLEVLSGFLLFQYNHYQGSVWFTQANTAAAMVHEWEAKALSYLRMPAENAALVQRNIVLQNKLDVLRHELALTKADTSSTQKMQEETLRDMTLIPAQIVDNSVRKRDNMLVINVGSNDGVAPEMGVVSGTGVVGIVSAVTQHHALVMSILNSHSSISCRLRGTEYFGYLKWKGGKPLRAYMDDVPRHAHIQKGDVIETSGFSSVFPAGIFLGKVAEIKNSSDGLAYELEILLSTDIANLRHVNVIDNHNKAEIDSLLTQ
ncbi:MAG: rod shape-determining protein MreC [Bacteroidaceae bacterium]|nr:rod shape-determining protein MreC [Bacteroidaceae bacterium]MBP5631118.1 rod shape-determining protein MreC [Bacteroidaceae bacterium]